MRWMVSVRSRKRRWSGFMFMYIDLNVLYVQKRPQRNYLSYAEAKA